MISLDILEKIEIFKSLNDKELKAVQAFCEQITYAKGDKLFSEGETADKLCFVVNGQVDLRFELPGKRHAEQDSTVSTVKGYAEEAKTLGWSCFVPPHKFRLSAYCVTRKCEVVRIKKDHITRLFDLDPLLGFKVMSYLVEVVGYRFCQFQDEVAKMQGHNIINSW